MTMSRSDRGRERPVGGIRAPFVQPRVIRVQLIRQGWTRGSPCGAGTCPTYPTCPTFFAPTRACAREAAPAKSRGGLSLSRGKSCGWAPGVLAKRLDRLDRLDKAEAYRRFCM